ncbi:MAG TPA: LamG domain-containing protein [Verrucomicrobiae bacterium]
MARSFVKSWLWALALLMLGGAVQAAEVSSATQSVLEMKGLVSFWDFQEASGSRKAQGPFKADLMEGKEGVGRAEEGLFGPHSLKLKPGQWLRIPREKLGPLNIHGPKAQVTVIAWVKREGTNFWQSIAGVWDETHSARQYMLFLNARTRTDASIMKRVLTQNRIHGHISSSGGASPGEKFWISYASSGSEVSMKEWHMIALTYDAQFIRMYLDGKLDAWENSNPFPYKEGIFDGGAKGADFTVGANHVAGIENNNRFSGLMAGLAVFDRALTDEEMGMLAAKTLPSRK